MNRRGLVGRALSQIEEAQALGGSKARWSEATGQQEEAHRGLEAHEAADEAVVVLLPFLT